MVNWRNTFSCLCLACLGCRNKENWKDIHDNFTSDLQKKWQKNGFTYEECKEWIDEIGLGSADADYCAWLRDIKEITPEWVLNYDNNELLKKQYEDYKKDKIDLTENEVRQKYEKYGSCSECDGSNVSYNWCQVCSINHLEKNFSNWTSGNKAIDELIREQQLGTIDNFGVLEWIPYDRLEIEKDENRNNKILARGGFGEVYKANWIDGYISYWDIENNKWHRKSNWTVALKVLNDSQNITSDFLQEINYYKLFSKDANYNGVAKFYGISQDPKTKNYAIVMHYKEGGNLRQFLRNNYSELKFRDKLEQLRDVVIGLDSIHKQGLIHRDLHAGNILSGKGRSINSNDCYVADLGLCRPVSERDKSKNYGVLPYVAPEVLQGQIYTQASDVYSFSMIMYEMFSGLPPFYSFAHDESLSAEICQGLRPNLDDIKVPQMLEKLISRCWDADPKNRPASSELLDTLNQWKKEINDISSLIYQQVKELEKLEVKSPDYEIHSQAVYTSRPLTNFSYLSSPNNSQSLCGEILTSQEAQIQVDPRK